MLSQAIASSIRRVPRHSPTSGMTFGAAPEWIAPQMRAAELRGSRRRVSTAGSSVTILASA